MGSKFRTIFGIIFALVAGWYFFGGGLEQLAATDMDRIYKKVASDAVTQYGITKRGGSKIDACVHAGLVAAAYLQAKDEPNYKQWKVVEFIDCNQAGVTRF